MERNSSFFDNVDRFLAWVVGWIVFALMATQLVGVEEQVSANYYDPFAILEISSSSTPEEIRKQYKRLSLVWCV
jgi:preprotein translocase subunit Sec63